jgi:hypothetical protein
MKSLLILLSAFLLTGCLTTVPVKHKFPDVPEDLKVACPDLKTVQEDTTKLSDVLKTVTENYSQYKECQIKVDLWIEWYTQQKKIFDEVK